MSRRQEKRTVQRYMSGAPLKNGDHKRLRRWRRRMKRYHGFVGGLSVMMAPSVRLVAQFVDTARRLGISFERVREGYDA